MISFHRNSLIFRWVAILLAVVCVGLFDLLTSMELNLVPLYVFPIAYAAWHFRARWSFLVAVFSSLVWFLTFQIYGEAKFSSVWVSTENVLVKIFWFSIVILSISYHKRLMLVAEEKIQRLQASFPVCSCCRRIGDPDGNWFEIEDFLNEKTQGKAEVKICPRCSKESFAKARYSPVDLGHEKKAYR